MSTNDYNEMATNKFIGQRIREAREKEGLTQEQLAQLFDTSKQYISLLELGLRTITAHHVKLISDRTGKSTDYFINGD